MTQPPSVIPDPAIEPFMSVPAVAKAFSCTDAVIYAAVERNEIPSIRLGTRKGLRIPTKFVVETAAQTTPHD